MGENAMMFTQEKKTGQVKGKWKGKLQPYVDIKKESKRFLDKKKGRIKIDCVNHKKWLR